MVNYPVCAAVHGQTFYDHYKGVTKGASDLKIKDKLFVVTGAAQGLGRAISLKLAEQGAALAV
ncbi:MAG: hypothetical protein ACI8XW_000051, partial [Gammaproteobacteria bacterium]